MSIQPLLSPRSKTLSVVAGLLASIAGCAPSPAPTPVATTFAPVADRQQQLAAVGHKQSCIAHENESPGDAFVRVKVHHLSAPSAGDRTIGFDYKNNGYADPAGRRGYRRPAYDDALSRESTAALSAAFGFLNPSFQRALCKNLDYVFVDDNEANFSDDGDSGMGWAFWEVTAKQTQDYQLRQKVPATTQDQADGRGRFIALPGSLIAKPPSVQTLLRTTFEKLLGGPGHPVGVPDDFITVSPTDGTDIAKDERSAALAAVMLHELGHVLWFQTCVAGKSKKCDSFRMVGWKTDLIWPSSGIHNPKLPLGAVRKGAKDPGIDEIINAARGGDLTPLYNLLGVGPSLTVTSNNFVSLLSATSPDEDFAETLTILGLQRNKLQVVYHGPENSPKFRPAARNFNPTKARLAAALLPSLLGPTTTSGVRATPELR